mmetsp:Transcript_13688/g.30181  ORF Transcript_13688/g.30181 Transcript_13688/m.30181 type:complete len:530 (+) Transcript_13688:173-1762(+)
MFSHSRRLGIILFSSCILLGVANILNPFGSMLRGGPRIRARPEKHAEEGELIVYGSLNFSLGLWKLKFSEQQSGKAETLRCELEVINELDEPILICWVDDGGFLRHYRPVNDRSIKDSSVRNSHMEHTSSHDHFVCIRKVNPLPAALKDIPEDAFICSYTPLKSRILHTLTIRKPRKRLFSFYKGGGRYAVQAEYSDMESGQVIDSTHKVYAVRAMCGFKVHYEQGVFEVAGFEGVFEQDLEMLQKLLPAGACAKLRFDTPIWLNASLTYGTKKRPVVATSCCYHPLGGADWLRANGLTEQKEGCVEIFSAADYLRTRGHWGVGGVLVHEFSHVYHDKHCEGGYECPDIHQAYLNAMEAKLYDSVSVHGPQGANGKAKAYACTNCMEFWAELSVAYLYALDDHLEYNKWFPFNHKQLLAHDSASHGVLARYWGQFDASEGTVKVEEGASAWESGWDETELDNDDATESGTEEEAEEEAEEAEEEEKEAEAKVEEQQEVLEEEPAKITEVFFKLRRDSTTSTSAAVSLLH